jgi:hypothetical protein
LKDAHDRQILKLEREYDALINRERELSERAAAAAAATDVRREELVRLRIM